MYDSFRGKIQAIGPTKLVLDCGGVGYHLEIPVSTYEALPKKGEAFVFAHLHVREDAMKLYGFASENERGMFLLLQRVSGIGPTVALNILSRASITEIADGIVQENVAFLKSLKGVGPKTAQRLVTELRDAAGMFSGGAPKKDATALSSAAEDAVAALLVLGYQQKPAEKAVEKAAADHPSMTVGELVRAALKSLT